jgi:hypothetical protein
VEVRADDVCAALWHRLRLHQAGWQLALRAEHVRPLVQRCRLSVQEGVGQLAMRSEAGPQAAPRQAGQQCGPAGTGGRPKGVNP